MILYFLRHGEAADRQDPKYPEDADRPLTKVGIKEMLCVAEALIRLKVAPDVVLTSPLVRARQTAEIVSDMLGVKKKLIDSPPIAEGFDLKKLTALLGDHPSSDRIMLVGHEPDFSQIIRDLIGGGRIDMKKAGLARIDFVENVAKGKGELIWLLAPRILLTIGKR